MTSSMRAVTRTVAVAIGAVALPLMILLALAKIRRTKE